MPVALFRSVLSFTVFSVLLPHSQAQDRSSGQPQGLRQNVPSIYAITGARVIQSPGRELQNATIVIRDDRITTVGTGIAIPKHARIIKAGDRTVYAGFIDAFSEEPRGDGSVSKNSRYWNSQIRPASDIARSWTQNSDTNDTFRKQGVTARLAAPSSGVIKGFGAVVLTSNLAPRHAVIRAEATQHARLTIGRNSDRIYPNSPMGAVALARQAFYDADWFQKAWRAAESDPKLTKPERNDDLAALSRVIKGRIPFIVDTSNELFFLRADRFAREFGLNLIVRGSGNEYRRLDAIRRTGRPVILPVNFPKPPNVATIEAALDATTESLMHWDHAPENPARVAEAGIPFALTSHGLSSRDEFLTQVRKAVSRGLDANEALRALTTTPASLLGVSSQIGSVEPGRLANLVVTDGPVFESETKILETWVAGERFEFTPKPSRKPAGTWTLTPTTEVDPGFKQLEITLEDGDDLKASVRDRSETESKKSITAGRVILNGARLSVTFRSDDLGHKGVARLTFVVDPDSRKPSIGNLELPDGTLIPVRLIRDRDGKKAESDGSAKDAEEESARKKKPAEDGSKQEEQPAESRSSSFPVNFPLGAFGRHDAPEQPALIAFRNATVWTCGKAGILKKATVLVRKGRILQVGRRVKIPHGTVIINAKGMHLTPGVIDCHSHFATDGGVNESGQAVTAEVRIGDFIDCDDINIYRQLAGGVTSSNILHGSANPIGGQNHVVKLRWGALDSELTFAEAPTGIKFALGENVKQSNWGDEFTSRYPQTRMGVEQVFRDEFQAAREYKQAWARWKQRREGLPPRRDLELDAIVEILEGSRWIHCHSYRQDEILALIRLLDENNIRIGTFQHILEGYKVADAMAKHGAMGSAFSDWWAYKFEVYDAIPYAGALMHDAGVVVSFNSDDRELARHLNHEAGKAMKYGGVPAVDALKFVTLNPAKQLRIDKYVGSIEPGKHADLALWSGPPMSPMSRCEQTWIDGRKYFDRQTDHELRKENRQIRTTLIQKILDSGEPMRKPGEGDGDPASLWPREDLFCHGHDHGHDHHRD